MEWCEYFTYDPDTGNLIWKERPVDHFRNNRAWRAFNYNYANRVAGHRSKFYGYVVVAVTPMNQERRLIPAHRIIWEMHNGPISGDAFIDHLNGDRDDNRLCNLRLATSAQNARNASIRKDNSSGFKGVGWHSRSKKWIARIRVNGQIINLGSFDDPSVAGSAYDAAAVKHFGEYAKPNNDDNRRANSNGTQTSS